jgi:phosphoribosylamine---glycine ligase
MKVCVVGSGGREHALALALSETADVVVAPGNPGMASAGAGRVDKTSGDLPGNPGGGYPITISDLPPEAISADLFVVGPEQPLVDGLAD